MDPRDLAAASDRFVLHSLRRDRCLTFVRGDNARLWDADGREFLDTMSGSAGPAMVGHANPRVAAAVAEQMARLPTTNILHQSDAVIAYVHDQLAERLADDRARDAVALAQLRL